MPLQHAMNESQSVFQRIAKRNLSYHRWLITAQCIWLSGKLSTNMKEIDSLNTEKNYKFKKGRNLNRITSKKKTTNQFTK